MKNWIGAITVIALAFLFVTLGSCARASQYEVEQTGLCLEPPEEHLFAWEDQSPRLIYQFACMYENTSKPNACCDYLDQDPYNGIYCMHRFCTEDCRHWEFAGYACPDSLQGLLSIVGAAP